MDKDVKVLGYSIPKDTFDKLVLALVFGVIAFFIVRNNWGTDTLGSFFQRSNYKVQYYVYLQPDNAESKNYRVVADIIKGTWSETDGEESYGGNSYLLDKVYWPNGGSSEFDDCQLWDLIESNKTVDCSPMDEDQSYEIRLGEKVK